MPKPEPPSLSDLQRWMRWTLTHPQGVDSALRQPHALKTCLTFIGETADVKRAKRLSIYGDGYFWRIIEALGSTYSSVKNVMGADVFNTIARDYLVRHPSTFKSIDDIGQHLSALIKKRPISRKFPFLSDLAAFEWAAHQSFFADDVPLLDFAKWEAVSDVRWLNARFTLDPSVRLLKTAWPVDELWRDDGVWTPEQFRSLPKKSSLYLIYRDPSKFVRAPLVTPVQFELLRALDQQQTLGDALSSVLKHLPKKQPMLITDWFRAWARQGVIKKIEFGS